MSLIESELLSGASLVSPNATRRRFVRLIGSSPLELPGAQIDLLLGRGAGGGQNHGQHAARKLNDFMS